MRRTIAPMVAAVLLAATFFVTVRPPLGEAASAPRPTVQQAHDAPGTDWPAYLGGPSHDSYNASATAITPSNVGSLAPAWKWVPPPSPNSATTNLLASPTVVNGVVYQGAKDGYVFAISETTHQTIWSRFLAINTPLPVGSPSCGVGDYQGVISTPTVVPAPGTGTLTEYVYAPDGFLYALDAATGNIVWRSQVYVPSTTVNDYYSWGSPLVANGKVYIGVSSDCDNPLVPGGLASFDQASGAPVARWVDVPAGQLGGSVWSSPGLAADGSIIVTTGNASAASGQPLYNESIVRLDPTTLVPLDSWQVPAAQQSHDGDFGASPTMFTATIGGISTPMVGACNKNGVYYAFRQSALSAGPVWQTTISVPYPGGAQECDSAATWDGTHLVETGGAPTTINGLTYVGSIRSLDPATGAVIWQTGLNGTIVGSPTEDGWGVIAAPAYQTCPITTTPCETNGGPAATLGVYLVSVASGAIVGFVPTPKSPLFGQAVFVGNDLLVGGAPTQGLVAYAVPGTGPPPPPPPSGPGQPGALAPPVSGMASTPGGDGYWLTDRIGAVSPHGAAQSHGSLAGHPLNAPVAHIVATPDGRGYWLVAGDGGVFTFGDAGFFGSTGNLRLNAPVVDLAPTPSGHGYWLVASDGGVFSFGDAAFHGSMGGVRLNKPVVGISADPATGGYWLVASDGGVFSFGAPFYGSTGNLVLNQPVNGMAATADGGGYWFVASDGGVFSFGDAVFHGSTGNIRLNAPVVGMAADPATGGYWLVASDGGVFSFGAPFYGAG